tara:strand:- start:920 stop:1996 length:1077 start_codon:yes stop_codon:yes gene_type:complete
MATPTISLVYPSNGATAVPVGADIQITFSCGIDLSTVKNNVVIYGKDTDFISGPETATFIRGGESADFLKSPGFKGVVPCDFELVYVDSNGDKVDVSLKSRAEEEAGPYKHKLIVSPKSILAPNVLYTVYIIGEDEEGTSKGVSSRTVYEVDESAVTSTTGDVFVYGGYTRGSDDTINIKITTEGSIGTAKYKWWYASETESDAREGKVTSRRFRMLEDNLQVRFSGSGFNLDDTYTVSLNTQEFLDSSLSFSFTTSTTQIQEVPTTTSTTVIGTEDDPVVGSLKVVESSPEDGDTNLSFNKKQIIIEFDEELDSSTISNDTVTILSYPISGIIDSTEDEEELFKKLTVSGKKLIIDL